MLQQFIAQYKINHYKININLSRRKQDKCIVYFLKLEKKLQNMWFFIKMIAKSVLAKIAQNIKHNLAIWFYDQKPVRPTSSSKPDTSR